MKAYRSLNYQFLWLLLALLLLLFLPPSTQAQSKTGITRGAEMSAFVGEYQFTLFGYTSPQAKVTIFGFGIFDQTQADNTGYFRFANRFSPFSPRDACLTAQDVVGRLSAPLCLPPFPTQRGVSIGPVILPPTVSVDLGEYYVGDEAYLSGQTVPDTEVDFSFFVEPSNPIGFPSSAYAISLPEIKTSSDDKGNFSVSIPTNSQFTLRTFARSNFLQTSSPKSITLNIKVLPWWMVIWRIFGFALDILKDRLLELIILFQIIVIAIFLLRRILHPHPLAKTKALMLRPPHSLEETGDFQTR